MIVVPLLVDGEAIGTLNIGRMGEEESHFSANEFELTKLFAGQASIALQNAETHGEVRIRAEQDALTGLRNHGAFQRELGEAVDDRWRRQAVRGPDDGPRRVQGLQRLARPSGRRRAARRDRPGDGDWPSATTTASTATAATSSRRSCPTPTAWRPTTSRTGSATPWPRVAVDAARTPTSRSASASPASPMTAAGKDALVTVADRAMYLAKPAARSADRARRRTTRTCGRSTRPPSPCSTDATRRRCSRRS